MTVSAIALSLALLAPGNGVQERTSVPPQAVVQDLEAKPMQVLPELPRIHPLPVNPVLTSLARAEVILRDPKASPAMRRAAYSEYVKALEQGTAFDRAQEIAETVRFVLEPEFESEPFEVRPTIDGKGLLALGSPAQHAAIAEVIVELQRETRMIDIKASIVQVKGAELEGLTGGRTARTITGAELEALRKQLAERDIISTPRVLVDPGAPAVISTGKQIAYVADIELTVVADGDEEIADPKIDVLFEGLTLDIRAAPRDERLRCQVKFTSSQLERPIPTQTLHIGAMRQEAKVQRPVLTTIEASALFDLKDDAAVVLVATEASGQGDDAALVILTATLIEAPAGPR